ncbi:hypothetical protein PWT90_10082 [Aphanocladium album]|nr:hypothetical protein PWT90_10082 [Aphanocladium album]
MSSKPEDSSQQDPWTGEAKQKFQTYAIALRLTPSAAGAGKANAARQKIKERVLRPVPGGSAAKLQVSVQKQWRQVHVRRLLSVRDKRFRTGGGTRCADEDATGRIAIANKLGLKSEKRKPEASGETPAQTIDHHTGENAY